MTKKEISRIAINTGGGDAPGLNAVIRAAVLSAEPSTIKVWQNQQSNGAWPLLP